MHTLREKTAAAILQWARKNRLQAGDALPSERELAELTSVSHGTVNRAITRLAAQGRLKREGRKSILLGETEEPDGPHKEEVTVLIGWQLLSLWPVVERVAAELSIAPRIEVDQTLDASGLRKTVECAGRAPYERLLLLHLQTSENLSPEVMRKNPGIVACGPGIDIPSAVGMDHDALYQMVVTRLVSHGAKRLGLLTPSVCHIFDSHWSLFRHWCDLEAVRHYAFACAYPGDVDMTRKNIRDLEDRLPRMDGLVICHEWFKRDSSIRDYLLDYIEAKRRKAAFHVVALEFEPPKPVSAPVEVLSIDWEAQIRVALMWLKASASTPLTSVRVRPRWSPAVSESPPEGKNGSQPHKNGEMLACDKPWPQEEYLFRPFSLPSEETWSVNLKPWLNRLTNRHHSWLGGDALKHFGSGKKCLAGIPFLVSPDEKNRGAACVVFRSQINRHGLQGELPVRLRIPVGKRVKQAYFLHACGWIDAFRQLATYRLILKGGEKREMPVWPLGETHPKDIPPGVEPCIQDWWPSYRPVASLDSRPVVLSEGPFQHQMRFLYVLRWRLPVTSLVEALEIEVDPEQKATLALLAGTLVLSS